jgi:hypothetical protein
MKPATRIAYYEKKTEKKEITCTVWRIEPGPPFKYISSVSRLKLF